MEKKNVLDKIKGGLIVSCQALDNEPLHGSLIMARMALAAKEGGASGIRANTVGDINEIRKTVDLPIIGIIKKVYSDSEIYITPTMDEVEKLINSSADIIAFDATIRKRPMNTNIEDIVKRIKESGKIAMGDISTLDEGLRAAELGIDIVSTTLSGYTKYSPNSMEPDFNLIKNLSSSIDLPVIAEGKIKNPQDLVKCFECGAYSVVVGAAITRPQLITKSFVEAIDGGVV